MSVHICISGDESSRGWHGTKVESPRQVLADITGGQLDGKRTPQIIQSSLANQDLKSQYISSSSNGFVWAAVHAYSSHLHLTIRPDDVWLAILTQLSLYINANSQDLRSILVAHHGEKEITVDEVGSLEDSVDFAALAQQLAKLVAQDIRDDTLKDWVMPDFSTTTDDDLVVAAAVFLGILQEYYSYTCQLSCGIPSVTLQGTLADWQAILGRLDNMSQLGTEPTQFAEMLRPILKHMIYSFENPTDNFISQFWNSIADAKCTSGSTTYSGWIAAFCFWDSNGLPRKREIQITTCQNVFYPAVESHSIPAGFSAVPIKVDDNGTLHDCTLLAGSVGIQARSIQIDQVSPTADSGTQPDLRLDSIQPISAWYIYKTVDKSEAVAKVADAKNITPNGAFDVETIKAVEATQEFKDLKTYFQRHMAQFED